MNLFSRLKRIHPIVNIAFVTLLIKSLTLVHYYFTDEAVGDVAKSLFFSISYQLTFTGLVFSVLLALWYLLKPVRGIFSLMAFLYCILSVLLCQIDLFLVRFTGMRFTPSIIRTYGLEYMVHPDVLQTVFANPAVSAGVIVLVVGLLVLFFFYNKIMKSAQVMSFKTSTLIAIPVGFGLLWMGIIKWDSTYYMQARPTEISFTQYSSYNVSLISDSGIDYQKENNEVIRRLLKKEVTNEEFPFYTQRVAEDSVRTDHPDIILIMIESLRGEELSFINKENPATTPNIDSLVQNAVAYPEFIANGYPTDDGMFSMHTSVVPHYIKKNVRDNYTVQYRSLPQVLSEAGFYTFQYTAVEPTKPMMFWFDQWYDEVIAECEDGHCQDKQLFDNAKDWLAKYDSDSSDKPVFMYLHTNDTHLPFRIGEIPDSHAGKYPNYSKGEYKDLGERYRACVEWTDYSMGEFLGYLTSRRRRDNTIIVFMGDHAKETTQKFKSGTRYFPMNAFMRTGALISGPQKYVGAVPRAEEFPASGVDILPTVANMLNLQTSYASWGNSLIGNVPADVRTSVSVRPGGIRYNWGDSTMFVNSNNPNDYWVTAFESEVNDKNGYRTAKLDAMAVDVYNLVHYGSYLIEANKLIEQ